MALRGHPLGVRLRDADLPDIECLRELIETVRSLIDQFSRSLQIVLLQRSTNLCFFALEKACEQFRCDVRLIRECGIRNQLITQSDRGADYM